VGIAPVLSGLAPGRPDPAVGPLAVGSLMTGAMVVAAQTLLLALLAPAVVGYVRKVKARLQSRRGAGVLQPYRDVRKTFAKDMVVPDSASWIFHQAPVVVT